MERLVKEACMAVDQARPVRACSARKNSTLLCAMGTRLFPPLPPSVSATFAFQNPHEGLGRRTGKSRRRTPREGSSELSLSLLYLRV